MGQIPEEHGALAELRNSRVPRQLECERKGSWLEEAVPGSRAQMSDEFSEGHWPRANLEDTGPGGECLLWNWGRSNDVRVGKCAPSQLEWRLDVPGATQGAPWVPRHNSRIPMQLKKNHEVPPLSWGEAPSRWSLSREISRSLLKFETVLNTRDATQKVSRHTGLTREEHQVSRHYLIWAPSPLLISKWGSIPLLFLEGDP